MLIQYSKEDKSVNFILEREHGMLEARFVQRDPEYYIVYLSSFTGCNRSCRMCHLTATGQTSYDDAHLNDFMKQAHRVYEHINSAYETKQAKYMHFNFMARGEPLDNPVVKYECARLIKDLGHIAEDHNVKPEFLFSTILPKDLDVTLTEIAEDCSTLPRFYYSLYSVNEAFRHKWLKKAMCPDRGLDLLAEYHQKYPEVKNKIHFAFIEGENDSEEDMLDMCNTLKSKGLAALGVNIVRYNPHSEKYGKESDIEVIEKNVEILSNELNTNIKMVSRVGFDVKASCGMFVG